MLSLYTFGLINGLEQVGDATIGQGFAEQKMDVWGILNLEKKFPGWDMKRGSLEKEFPDKKLRFDKKTTASRQKNRRIPGGGVERSKKPLFAPFFY